MFLPPGAVVVSVTRRPPTPLSLLDGLDLANRSRLSTGVDSDARGVVVSCHEENGTTGVDCQPGWEPSVALTSRRRV